MEKTIRIMIYTLVYIAFICFKILVINKFSLFSVKPNLFLVLIITTFMNFDIKVGLIYSIFTGVFLDILYMTNGFGIYTFSYLLLGIVIYILCISRVKKGSLSAIYLTIIGSIVLDVISYFTMLFKYSVDLGFFRLLGGAMLFAILNIAFTAIINQIISKIGSKREGSSIYFS